MEGSTGEPLQMDIALPHAIFQKEKVLQACLHDFLFDPVLCEEWNIPKENKWSCSSCTQVIYDLCDAFTQDINGLKITNNDHH